MFSTFGSTPYCQKTSRRLYSFALGVSSMSKPKHPPGSIRDAILGFLTENAGDASVAEIRNAMEQTIGSVPPSSVRSYLRLRPDIFERTVRGRYQILDGSRTAPPALPDNEPEPTHHTYTHGNATLYQADSFQWMASREPNSIHAVVTDPPYGLVEYSEKEQLKLLNGKGGVWRIPPAFDGHMRSPLPRFTTLTASDLEQIRHFFKDFGCALTRVLVPGAHVFVASNPLLSYIVADALDDSGLENRGIVTRLVMTMRGGDRPKNAHEEFSHVTVMPRSMAEPWLLFRKPLEGRVQDNLRKWGTGGLRRVSPTRPFGDVIESHPTRAAEKKLAPHPSLKPQAFLRQLVRAALPMEKGVILDPFAGSGSTLAAANHIGYRSIGIELSERYVHLAINALPQLQALKCPNISSCCAAS